MRVKQLAMLSKKSFLAVLFTGLVVAVARGSNTSQNELLTMDLRKQRGTISRGMSNNNPFNIKYSKRVYTQKVPLEQNTDYTYALTKYSRDVVLNFTHEQFETYAAGIAAGIDHLRKRYILGGLGKGNLNTIAKIFPIYAPASSGEGNVPTEYIKFLELRTGINRNEVINENDYQSLLKLTRFVLIYENGWDYADTYLSEIIHTAIFEIAWKKFLNLP
jgi:hypothetical protein